MEARWKHASHVRRRGLGRPPCVGWLRGQSPAPDRRPRSGSLTSQTSPWRRQCWTYAPGRRPAGSRAPRAGGGGRRACGSGRGRPWSGTEPPRSESARGVMPPRLGLGARHRGIGVVERVVSARQHGAGLTEHATGRIELSPKLEDEVGDDRAVLLPRRCRRDDPTADQLVAAGGAVVPASQATNRSTVQRFSAGSATVGPPESGAYP